MPRDRDDLDRDDVDPELEGNDTGDEGDRAHSDLKNEVKAEREGVKVTLKTDEGEEDLHVPTRRRWQSRAVAAMNHGDFELWAELTLSDEDFEAWLDLDPTVGDVEDFFTRWMKKSGANRGKSRSSRRSSRSTRRR